MDQAIQQVMENYSATALSVAVVERGEVTQCGAWGLGRAGSAPYDRRYWGAHRLHQQSG